MLNNKKSLPILPIVVAGIGLLAILIVIITKFVPTSKRMGPEEYFGILQEQEATVILDDQIAQERALILDGSIYIDYSLVQSKINSRFHWDASVGLMLLTTADQVIEFALNDTHYSVNGEEFDAGYEILKTTSAGMFLSANFMKQYTDIECTLFDAPTRVVLTSGSREVVQATVKKDSAVRYMGGIKSPIITDVTADSTVSVLVEMDNWSQIRTADGYIGYIKNNRLKNKETVVTETWYQGTEYSSIHLDKKVNLIWHQIDYPEMNENLESDTVGMTGVNVISPTWYYLTDNEGSVGSFASAAYVEKAHAKGLQVWALIRNFGEDVSTSTVLASRSARQKIQSYLIAQALELGLDGINIDFEGIVQEAGYDYVQFMRELSILCRKEHIVLSVDVPVPMEFSRHYNRGELGKVCDYVIMMGYDEHYYGCEQAGSVASMEFERTGIENMLSEMTKEKLISAIPFYSRIWYTGKQEDGTDGVTSRTVTMPETQQILSDLGIEPSHDESTGQDYAQWTAEDGRLCEIWIENEASTAARAEMVAENDLGGIAAWVLGDQTDSVWAIIDEKIH